MSKQYLINEETLIGLADSMRAITGAPDTTKFSLSEIQNYLASQASNKFILTRDEDALINQYNEDTPGVRQNLTYTIELVNPYEGYDDLLITVGFAQTTSLTVYYPTITFDTYQNISKDCAIGLSETELNGDPDYFPGRLLIQKKSGSKYSFTITFTPIIYSAPQFIDYKYMYVMVSGLHSHTTDIIYLKIPHLYWPCFLTDTPITLADYSTKVVQDITYNDNLLVWDFDNGYYTSAKPLWIKKKETASYYYQLKFNDNTKLNVVGSGGYAHRVFSLDTNSFEYANLCVGHRIQTSEGIKTLISCEIIHKEVEFYNIITNYHMNCYANTILTSTGLNNIYPIKNMQFIKNDREIIAPEKFSCNNKYYTGLRLGEQHNYSIKDLNDKIQRIQEKEESICLT